MPYYLYQDAYTAEGWASQMKNPQDRIEAVRPAVERLGGRIVNAWLSFGEYDVVAILEMPDNVSIAAFAIAVAAGGAVKAGKTTPLLTVQEWVEAARKAGGVSYQPPR